MTQLGTRPFIGQVELSCQVTISGEVIRVRQIVAEEVYRDGVARPLIEQALREHLVREIVERWKPVVKVRR